MSIITLPVTWTYDGDTPSQSTYRVDGHTVQENFLATFSRKVPASNGNGGFSKPNYQFQITRSFVDGDGVPVRAKGNARVELDWPLEATSTQLTEMIAELKTVVADTNFADMIISQLIPREEPAAE